jgi:hypothetical protein
MVYKKGITNTAGSQDFPVYPSRGGGLVSLEFLALASVFCQPSFNESPMYASWLPSAEYTRSHISTEINTPESSTPRQ